MINRKRLFTCISPALISLYDLENTITVVIDIFRATSTICAAIDNGARSVIPVATVEECLHLEKSGQTDLITAGERDGKVIAGLKCGNSPLEYPPDVISGKTLALTTTNGTRLLHHVKKADEVIIGSFLNLDAICAYLVTKNKDVLLACAGWRDKINLEDTLFAGAVIKNIGNYFDIHCDSSLIARSLYEDAGKKPSLLEYMKAGSHYHRLSAFNLEKDMEYCCQLNLHPVVPVFNGYALVDKKEVQPNYPKMQGTQ